MLVGTDEIEWGPATLPASEPDPAFAKLVSGLMGGTVPAVMTLIHPSLWVRETYLWSAMQPRDHLEARIGEIVAFVTSQEGSCRYCYGITRTTLRLVGFSEAQVQSFERDFQIGERRDREVIQFARALAKSNPRPARREADALAALGFGDAEIAEIAWVVASTCFLNRVATLAAPPPQVELEAAPSKWYSNLVLPITRWAMRRPRPWPDWPAIDPALPFAPVLAPLGDSRPARFAGASLHACFASDVLPTRTKAYLFAVVARSLGCPPCERLARGLLEDEGVSEEGCTVALERLGSPQLDEVEAVLVPWVRDTVRVGQAAPLQRRTRAMVERVGPERAIEAMGVAGLANQMVRLAMLGA